MGPHHHGRVADALNEAMHNPIGAAVHGVEHLFNTPANQRRVRTHAEAFGADMAENAMGAIAGLLM